MRPVRLKVLKFTDTQSHRYRTRRAVSQSISLLILILVPLLGLAQVDAWGGKHYLLGREAPFKHALAGVIVGIAALYVFTFLSNVVAGRLFCGWGCPVGQVSRFGERIDTPGLRGWGKARAQIEGAIFSGLFVVSMMAWWTNLGVLALGTPKELAVAWGLLAVGIVGAYLHGKWWRWEFCKSVCPIGLYYSFVAPAKYFGIHFRNEKRTCIECDACDNVCPVDLTPRDLVSAVINRTGVSISDAPGHNHCLECGDCIVACEDMVAMKKTPREDAPLKMGWYSGDQRGIITPSSSEEPSKASSL